MTRWKLEPWYPNPFSPVHSARKFSIVRRHSSMIRTSVGHFVSFHAFHPSRLRRLLPLSPSRVVESSLNQSINHRIIESRVTYQPSWARHPREAISRQNARVVVVSQSVISLAHLSSRLARAANHIVIHHRHPSIPFDDRSIDRSIGRDDDAPSSRCGRPVDHRSRRQSSTRGWTCVSVRSFVRSVGRECARSKVSTRSMRLLLIPFGACMNES